MKFRSMILAALLGLFTLPAFAQDKPTVNVGATIFTDYTYTVEPTTTDADGNSINASAFNVSRAYLNFTGKVNDRVSFRVTPDIVRSADGLVFRVKYAFAQIGINKDTWVRAGAQQTPYVDFIEGVYRYRFQGTTFTERVNSLSSSDLGVSVRTVYKFAEVHAGYYNGESYKSPEVNDQKGFMVRGTVKTPVSGLRATAFYVKDNYVQSAERNRFVGTLTYENPRVNAGFDVLRADDQTSVRQPNVNTRGYSFWATPKLTRGFEVLVRRDVLTSTDTKRNIVGVSYWFPKTNSAVLVDYDATNTQSKKVGVKALINF